MTQSYECLGCGQAFTALPPGPMEKVKCLECGHEELLPPPDVKKEN